MNRIMRRAAAVAVLAGGLGSAGCMNTTGATAPVARGVAPDPGCAGGGCGAGGHGLESPICRAYQNFVDPCYPERYSAVARAEVISAFGPQVYNGHVLNQTVWNWYFEPGTATLTPAGYAKLDSLAQTRPAPDSRIYLQVARDMAPGAVDGLSARRDELTAKRAEAVQKYMAAQPAINPVAYEIFVHDPVVQGIRADFTANAYRGQAQGYRGGIGGTSGVAATAAGGGGAPPAAGVGAPPPSGGSGGGGGGYNGGGGSGGGSGGTGPTPGGP